MNPAVTWAVVLTGRLSLLRGFLYVCAQIVGSIVAAALLAGITHGNYWYTLGGMQKSPFVNQARAFGCELVLTFIFVFVVFATAISPFIGKIAPLSQAGHDYGPGKLTPLALGMIFHMLGCLILICK